MASRFAVLFFGHKQIRCVLFSEGKDRSVFFAEKSIEYDGFSDTGFANPEDVFLKVERLVHSAESENGVVVKRVCCALPSDFFRYGVTEKDLAINGGVVTEKDVKNLLDHCAVGLPGYTVVEKLPLYYKSFNAPYMVDPVGQVAERLYVTASCGYLESRIKELFDNCAKKLKKEFVLNSYAMLAAKRLDHDFLKGVRRAVILFTEGYLDVALCEGSVPVEVRSIAWGESSVRDALAQLLSCDKETRDLVFKRVNLNLAFEDGDRYRIVGKEYSVKEVNSLVIEAIEYFAREVKKMLADLPKEDVVVYLTGCDLCENRGVKELFEDELGKDVYVAIGKEPNIEGCKNYILSAYAVGTDNGNDKSKGLFQKIFYRRK